MSTFGTSAYGQNIYGGPAVWSDSVPESASVADSVDAVAGVPMSEAGSLADTEDATGNYTAGLSVSEASTGAYAPTAIANFFAGLSIAEVLAATDAPDISAIFAGVVIEAGSWTDALVGQLAANAAISETGSASDAADIVSYIQAPLPVSARRNKIYLRS